MIRYIVTTCNLRAFRECWKGLKSPGKRPNSPKNIKGIYFKGIFTILRQNLIKNSTGLTFRHFSLQKPQNMDKQSKMNTYRLCYWEPSHQFISPQQNQQFLLLLDWQNQHFCCFWIGRINKFVVSGLAESTVLLFLDWQNQLFCFLAVPDSS